jgi:hypothetical protein
MGVHAGRPLYEGPDNSCIIDGKALGWTNCTPTSVAMAISKTTLGAKNPTPCDIRRLTGDTIGGTGLAAVRRRRPRGLRRRGRGPRRLERLHPEYLAGQLKSGRGAAVQGNTGPAPNGLPLDGRDRQSLRLVQRGAGLARRRERPFDPDRRPRLRPRGGRADGEMGQGRDVASVVAVGARQGVHGQSPAVGRAGRSHPRLGKVYCAIYGDTEPHVHLRFTGSARTSPFPRTLTAHPPVTGRKVNVRSGPSTRYPIVKTLASGAHFTAYQQNPNGALLAGSRLWYGDHDGRLWVHSSGLR